MFKLKLGAVALAFALTAVMPAELPYTGGLIGAPAAQAGILGKIKGAVKTVGSEAGKFAKDTAKAAKNAGKIAGGKVKTVGSEAGKFAKDTAKAAKNAGKIVGVDRAAKKVGAVAKDIGGNIGHTIKEDGKAIGRGAKAVGKGIVGMGSCLTGGLGCKFEPPTVPRRPTTNKPNPVPGKKASFKGRPSDMTSKLNIQGSAKPIRVKAPSQGIRKENLGIGHDKSKWGRPVGVKRKMLGRDKSVWGRPVGASKRTIRSQRKFGRGKMRHTMRRQMRNTRRHFGHNARRGFNRSARHGSGHRRRHR